MMKRERDTLFMFINLTKCSLTLYYLHVYYRPFCLSDNRYRDILSGLGPTGFEPAGLGFSLKVQILFCHQKYGASFLKHLRFICIKRKDTKEEQKKAEACGPHTGLRVSDADKSLPLLEERRLGIGLS